MQEPLVWFLGWEDPLEEDTATHFSVLNWKIPQTQELEGYSPWGCKELDMTEQVTHTLGLFIGFSTENVHIFISICFTAGNKFSQEQNLQPQGKDEPLGHGKVCWGQRWVFLDKIPGHFGPTAIPRENTWVLLECDCLLQWLGPKQQQEWPRREDENHVFMLQTVRSLKWGATPAFSLLHPWGFS